LCYFDFARRNKIRTRTEAIAFPGREKSVAKKYGSGCERQLEPSGVLAGKKWFDGAQGRGNGIQHRWTKKGITIQGLGGQENEVDHDSVGFLEQE
jgi:hypothetical protein